MMSLNKEILIIGTEPPCPRCDYLGKMVHELVAELDLSLKVRHVAFTDPEAVQLAESVGLTPGTAKHVAQRAGIEIVWEDVYRMIDNPDSAPAEQTGAACCPAVADKWTPELDLILRPCEEAAESAGIMMTPVLVVDGRIVHQGSVPSRAKTREWVESVYSGSESAPAADILVQVLGPGCANCETVYRNVFEALEIKGLQARAKVKKVTDIDVIAAKGVHVTPGLIINDEIVSRGKVLKVEQIVDFLNSFV